MKFGYARVSTNDQSLDIQIEKLKAVGCDEIFSEKVSGAKNDRKELNNLLAKLRKSPSGKSLASPKQVFREQNMNT